ncbi:hypothetical protein B0H13DRAFT_2374668, partial [Mycena leptocephala]
HASLKLRKINTYGLSYEWTGSNNTLKPVLLAAHQDVVPVEPSTVGIGIIRRTLVILTVCSSLRPLLDLALTLSQGHRFWGRGSADDKNGLIAILTAIEALLENGFVPTRTFVAAFGFDEEASGLEGAAGMIKMFGTMAALPDVAEKGYLDVVVDLTSPGGHSSVPPDHTTIGILAALLVVQRIHSVPDSPVPPAYESTMPPTIKRIIVDSAQSDTALQTLEGILSKDRLYRSQIGTTQAIDVVSGGVKSNALPEQAHAIVNHRISTESSVGAVRERNTAHLKPLAERFNLTFNAFGVEVSEPGAPASGRLTLTDMSAPAPVTPTSGGNSIPSANGDDSTVIVAPSIMSGNTDTRYYWKLSSHIFRYGHGNSAGAPEGILSGIHTVNECAYTIRDRTDTWLIFCATAIDADEFVEMIRFFVTLILNSDESIVL